MLLSFAFYIRPIFYDLSHIFIPKVRQPSYITRTRVTPRGSLSEIQLHGCRRLGNDCKPWEHQSANKNNTVCSGLEEIMKDKAS
jgi:hypothetical protein